VAASPQGAFGALVLGTLGIGFASIFAKLALATGEIGSTAIAFWRTAIAGAVLSAVWSLGRAGGRGAVTPQTSGASSRPAPPKASAWWLLPPGVLFALDLATWHHSFRFTTAAHATLLANLQVVLVGLYGWAVLKEQIRPRFVMGASLALIGVVVLLGVEGGGATLRGNLWAVSTAFFYAAYLVAIRGARRRFVTLTVMAASSVVAAISLFALALGLGEAWMPRSATTWTWVTALALVSHAGGQGLIAWSLPQLPVSLAGVTLLLQPVFAAVLGAVLLGEHLEPGQVAAGAVVLLGLELSRRSSRI
jgi:drug/metabolite transporter (DMT)-like permease